MGTLVSEGLPLTKDQTFDVRLQTASGSRYRITWDAMGGGGTLTREPAGDFERHPMSQGLRCDEETVPLLGFDRIDVGFGTTFVVDVRGDGIVTYRWANETVWIAGEGWTTAQ